MEQQQQHIATLKEQLAQLQQNHGLLSLKAGTEWEDMDYQEIACLQELGAGELPLLVKIAGAEAKVDLRHLQAIGVNGILGPMIESEYALEKFVTMVLNHYEKTSQKPFLAINLETIHAYEQLDALLNNRFFEPVDLVVIGRLDLSLSMHIDDVDHPKVAKVTQDIVKRVRAKGKDISIGGFVNPASAESIKNNFKANRLNTIHTLFDLDNITDVASAVWKGIEFEICYYDYLKTRYPERSSFYQERIETSQTKLDKAANFAPTNAKK